VTKGYECDRDHRKAAKILVLKGSINQRSNVDVRSVSAPLVQRVWRADADVVVGRLCRLFGPLGGFFGPWYVGVVKDWTGTYAAGIYGLAFLCLVSAVVCALFLDIPNPAARDRALAARSSIV